MVIMYIGTGYIQVLYLGRAPRTKETLPDFHEWRRVIRHPLVFRGLTGSQRTPGNWGVTQTLRAYLVSVFENFFLFSKTRQIRKTCLVSSLFFS